jgi:hypothetical protein
VTAPGRIIPEPMTAAAQERPRDPSGRVLAAIKIEVRFTRGRGGYRHYCASFAEAVGFLASPAFRQTAHIAKTVTITATDPDLGPDIDVTPPDWRDPGREARPRRADRGNP